MGRWWPCRAGRRTTSPAAARGSARRPRCWRRSPTIGSVACWRPGLTAAGVSGALLQRTELPTTLAVAELDERGGATYRFYTDGTSAPALTPPALPAGTDVRRHRRARPRPGADGDGDRVHRARRAPTTCVVVVDVNCRPTIIADREAYVVRLRRVLARADVVKVSDEDLAFLRPGVESRRPRRASCSPAAPASSSSRLAGRRRRSSPRRAPSRCPSPRSPSSTRSAPATRSRPASPRGGEGAVAVAPTLADVDALTAAVDAAHAVAAIVVGRRGADPPRRDELPPAGADRVLTDSSSPERDGRVRTRRGGRRGGGRSRRRGRGAGRRCAARATRRASAAGTRT